MDNLTLLTVDNGLGILIEYYFWFIHGHILSFQLARREKFCFDIIFNVVR